MDWKGVERRIADKLGCTRNPINGRGCQPDVESNWLAVEIKARKRLPVLLKKALTQAQAGAGADQLPLVVLHEANQRMDKAVVCMRLGDFLAWFGEGKEETDGNLSA